MVFQYIRELFPLIAMSCFITGIPFVFLWINLKRKYILMVSYLVIALLLFLLIDLFLTCSYEDGCGNGNFALLFIPGALLFFAFGLYALFYMLLSSKIKDSIIILFGSISLLLGLIGEYWYTIRQLRLLGIYDKHEFFLSTLINAGYFNQYLNRIHFNIFVFLIGIGGVAIIAGIWSIKRKH
ncbi:MAG: hypothetical protein ACI35O_14975 [Bacillaceae bacterium]